MARRPRHRSEGYGMNRLVREKCDFIVKIPMFDRSIPSTRRLRGDFLYEVVRRKKFPAFLRGSKSGGTFGTETGKRQPGPFDTGELRFLPKKAFMGKRIFLEDI
jgi:hypothetical protein